MTGPPDMTAGLQPDIDSPHPGNGHTCSSRRPAIETFFTNEDKFKYRFNAAYKSRRTVRGAKRFPLAISKRYPDPFLQPSNTLWLSLVLILWLWSIPSDTVCLSLVLIVWLWSIVFKLTGTFFEFARNFTKYAWSGGIHQKQPGMKGLDNTAGGEIAVSGTPVVMAPPVRITPPIRHRSTPREERALRC
ncbi:hypothetical protein Bbelb_120880 [Branchiostoma belcheri]|nr:hypothetical protein Bbelb_120880 [Branchiostoma belcheri]